MPSQYLQQLRKKRRHEDSSFQLIFRLEAILRNGWLIAAVTCIVALGGIVHALNVTPIYESNILIQIKRATPFSGEPQADIPAATEVEILRSRAILSRVVQMLQLHTSIEPKLFPVLGRFFAARNPALSAPGLFGSGGYVWGADRVRFSIFTVPDALQGRAFTLTVTSPDAVTLSEPGTGIRMYARVGELASLPTRYGPLVLRVADIRARAGAEFSVVQQPIMQAVEQLQRALVISEKVKQSNVITVSLQGSRPELLTRILNEIGKEYISQQVSQRTSEAKRQLAFYDQQMADSTRRLQQLDITVNDILRRYGTSDLNEEERLLAQHSMALKAKLEEKEQKKTEMLGRFAEQHPEIVTLSTVIRTLHREFNEVEEKRRQIASAQHDIISANRDKQVNSEMNIALLNARHKLDALMLTSNVNIRWIDRADMPTQPVTLGLAVMIGIACFMACIAGIAASILKNVIVRLRSASRIDRSKDFIVSTDVSSHHHRNHNSRGKRATEVGARVDVFPD